MEECGPCPVFASYILAFALKPRKEHGKTSAREESQTQSLNVYIKPLNAELNLICYLLALLGAHHFLHVSRIRVRHSDLLVSW